MKASVTEFPLTICFGFAPQAMLRTCLQLPSGDEYLNHLGTVHAAAQLALAEASSGEFLLRHFGSAEDLVPVVRRVEAKFRKPANGSILSTAHATPEALARLDAEFSSKSRSVISITVEVYDELGAHTLSGKFDWFIQREKRI